MVSEAKLQHLLEMRQVLELAYPHTQRYEMKGLHKVGDEILIRATIKRVDEGNIIEEIDVITGCGTGKWNGSAILDVQIDAMIPFSISDRSVLNETANERRERAYKATMDAAIPKPEPVTGFSRREITPREPFVAPIVEIQTPPANPVVVEEPKTVVAATIAPVEPGQSGYLKDSIERLGESAAPVDTSVPTAGTTSTPVESEKTSVSAAAAGDPVGESGSSAATVEETPTATDDTIPAPIPTTADLVAPAARLDL